MLHRCRNDGVDSVYQGHLKRHRRQLESVENKYANVNETISSFRRCDKRNLVGLFYA